MKANGLTAWELFCRRGDRSLFGSLDLWLERGEALHLVGPNGIGKSSLIRMLAGLLKPYPTGLAAPGGKAGTICWDGSIAMIDERSALDGDLPLERALAFWQRIDGGTAPLETVGLEHLSDVPVRYLSTGQKKRASLARLLGQNAANWLLDEPLNGLDAAGVALVEQLIDKHRAAGGVVVVASHQTIALPGSQVIDLRDHPA